MNQFDSKWILVGRKGISTNCDIHITQQTVRYSDLHQFNDSLWRKHIQQSSFFNNILQVLKNHTKHNQYFVLRCLCLGSFNQKTVSRIQFLFVLQLIKNIPTLQKLSIYDPIMTQQDKKEANQNHIYFQQNHQSSQGMIIYFVPHGEKFIYKEILQKRNQNIIIIGNSIKRYRENQILLEKQLTQQFNVQVEEIEIGQFEHNQRAFNDTVIQIINCN